MEGHWFKLENRQIYLTEEEMYKIHEYYVVQRNAYYLKEKYPNLPEEIIMEMAWEWRDKEMKEGYSNEDALAELLEECELL